MFHSVRIRDIINLFFMSKNKNLLIIRAIFLTFLLVSSVNAVPTPLPGEGDQKSILYMIHPNAKNNEIITSFLAKNPDFSWRESVYNKTHDYIYITPLNNCSEQLVYINKRVDERNEPSIVSVRIIGCSEELPLDPKYQFLEIFEKYPVLEEEHNLFSYIEDNSPNRYIEIEGKDPETEVYFIDDQGIFTEYIVTIRKGRINDNILYATFVSEDYFTINKSEAQTDAADRKPGWNITGDTLLKIEDSGTFWKITLSNGLGKDIVNIPTELLEGYSVIKNEPNTIPGFVMLTTVFSIGIVLAIISRRRS